MVLVGDDEDHVTNDKSRIASPILLVVGNDGYHAFKDKSKKQPQPKILVQTSWVRSFSELGNMSP